MWDWANPMCSVPHACRQRGPLKGGRPRALLIYRAGDLFVMWSHPLSWLPLTSPADPEPVVRGLVMTVIHLT